MTTPAHETVDVVVVGGGGAGLAAAIEAARFGCDVVLLEKNPTLGGTTIRSVGSITASCTPQQRALGIKDDPQAHFEDMALFADNRGLADQDNLELRRLLAEHSPDMVEWLMQMGVVFLDAMPEPPHRVPRMHNVLPHARSYIQHLSRRARQLGVQIRCGAQVESLLRENARVVGVALSAGGARITARRGVILATGDYSASAQIKSLFVPAEIAAVEGINPTSTGDGQALVREAGGVIVNGAVMSGPELRFVAPPAGSLFERIPPARPIALAIRWCMRHLPGWMLRPVLMNFVTTNLAPSPALFKHGAILVNQQGQRFVDERDAPERAVPRQTGRNAFILMDQQIAETFSAWPNFISTAPGVAYAYLADYRRNRRDIYHEAPTIAGLAAKLGVPADALERTVADYNTQLADGMKPLRSAPFCALGPVRSWVVFTDGGARISTRCEVLDAAGAPIGGLYAVGSAGQGGVLLEGHGHHLGWAFVSGRIAGRAAALGADPWPDAALAARRATAPQVSPG